MVATVVCFAVAIVLTVLPGPAFVFWILGFMFLGFGAGQILLSLHAVQEWMHRKVPLANRFPRLRKGHIRKVLRHRWIQMLDGLSGHRESRARRRAAAGTQPVASLHAGPKALAAVRERNAIGHAAAGREPPRRGPDLRFHATARIDQGIRDLDVPPVTEDERLLRPAPRTEFTHTDPWRGLRIMGEFVEGVDRLASVEEAGAGFGSPRVAPDGARRRAA